MKKFPQTSGAGGLREQRYGIEKREICPGGGARGEGGNKTYLTLNFSLQFYSFVILYS